MPRFPNTEAGIIALAQQILNGLNTNPNLENSPVGKAEFSAAYNGFIAKRDEAQVKKAQLDITYDEKENFLGDLTDMMRQVIDYLEALTGGNIEQMASVGWGSADEPTKQPPGQPRVLEIVSQTDATVSLDWKSNSDGGRAASYRVERRERPAGAWETCWGTNLTEAVLVNQPRSKELEWRVVGYNSNGDSPPSNTVAATL
jgi:hypothetical protein